MRGTLNAVSTFVICAAGLLLASVPPSLGQIPNPNGCIPSSYVSLDVFADSNATVFLDNQVLIPGEQVFYQAALLPGSGVCALSNGFFVVTTPDGSNHVVGASFPLPGPIPVTCGGGPPCNPFVLSEVVAYTVSTQDFAGCDLGGIPLPTAVAASVNVTNVTFICGSCSGFSTFQICNAVEIPCLQVVKLVACQPADGNCSNAAFSGFAKGVKTDSQIPAFCYSITITNCGTDNLTITNVSDNIFTNAMTGDFTNSTGVLGSTLLETNQAATLYFSTDLDQDTTNTVTVLGVENDSGFDFPVAGAASATAQVVQASLSCTLSASSADSLTPSEGCAVKLISNGSGHVVDYSILVTNTGSAALTNVTLTGSVPLTCGLTPTNSPFALPVGGATNIVCHETFVCSDSPINIRLLAVAGQVLTNQDVCALDSNGVPVQAVSTCSVAICCVPCTNPTCDINPKTPVCALTTNTYCSTVSPAGGVVTHSWSITGSGTITNANLTGACITVVAGASGSYTVTDHTTRDGCPGTCSQQITVNPRGQIGDFVWNDLNGNGCQDTSEPGLAGVKVDLYSGTCGGTRTLIKTTNTDSTGHYLFSGLCAGDYQVAITTPSGFTATTPLAGCAVNPGLPPDRNQTDSKCNCAGASPCFICVTLTPANPNNLNVDCGYITTGCPPCVDPALGLGAASGCSVLQLGAAKVSITGPAGGILGDICIAPNGSLSMSGDEFVTGIIKLGPGAKFSNSSHSPVTVVNNVNLTAEINAAYAAATSAASQPCTQSFASLNKTMTVTGGAGINVICVGDVSLSGKQVTLVAPAGAKFIINVTGKFVLTGGGAGPQIRVQSPLQPKDVLYNIIGAGADVAFSGGGGGVNCCAAIVDGTLLAPSRKINLSPGAVNGEIISGKDISIVSGSSVRCPSCPPKSGGPQ